MKSKLIWLLAVLIAGAAWLFENNPGTLAVLACTVALPALGLLPLLIPPKLSARWELPRAVEKGEWVEGALVIRNDSPILPVCLKLCPAFHNLRTGAVQRQILTVELFPGKEKRFPFQGEINRCGILRLTVEAVLQDWFDIGKRRISLPAQGEITVMPRLFFPEIRLAPPQRGAGETGETNRPGEDPGELRSIREYVPGDPIRAIHWKLSSKTDRLLTKEFSQPEENSLLLLLETSGTESPEEADGMTEVFASLCHALARQGIPHRTAWLDGDVLVTHTVAAPEDFASMLSGLLALPPREDGSGLRHLAEEGESVSHTVVIAGQIPEGVERLPGRVSVLLPRRSAVYEGLHPEGFYVLSYDLDNYAVQLSSLEV